MEVDEIENQGCNKYARSSNGNSRFESNKIEEDGGGRSSSGVDVGRLCGWPSASRIVRVSRASGGKDRHSKVWTSKGLRDRRVRLSVNTAIQFYDLQDRLGYDQPSKAVEWLLKAAATSISELPSLNGFPDAQQMDELEAQQQHLSKSACSSTSETSKGSGGLSLSRSENRVKARERARERAAEKEKEKETDIHRASHNSSFTELLTGGMNHNNKNTSSNKSPFEYYPSTSGFQTQISSPMFSITGDHHHQELQHFPFAMSQVTTHNNNEYNLNFSISSSSSSGLAGYNSGGTLQSNLSTLPHFPRYSSPVEGSQSFFNNNTMSAYDARLQLFYGDAHGNLHSDHKGKGTKN